MIDQREREQTSESAPALAAPGVAPALPAPAARVLALQRCAGNAAVSRWMSDARVARTERESETLGGLAAAGEADAAERYADAPPPVERVSNVHDVTHARAKAAQIEGYAPDMRAGVERGELPAEELIANDSAIAALDDYLITAGEQGRTLSDFQLGAERTFTDWARLMAQVQHLQVTGAVGPDAADGEDVATQLVQSLGFAAPDEMAAEVRDRVRTGVRDVGPLRGQAQEAHRSLVASAQEMSSAQFGAQAAVARFHRSLQTLASGIPARETDPALAAELSDIKQKIESVKKLVGTALDVVKEGAAFGGEVSRRTARVAKGVADAGVDVLVDDVYEAPLASIQSRVAAYNAEHRDAAITANVSDVRAAKADYLRALTDYFDTERTLEDQKLALRTALGDLGAAAGGPDDDRFSQVAAVLAEADAFVVQADLTIRLGEAEQNAARDASAAARSAYGELGDSGARGADATGMPYFQPYASYSFHRGGVAFATTAHRLVLPGAGLPWDERERAPGERAQYGAEAEEGVNPRVDAALAELREHRAQAADLRGPLGSALGLAMNEPGLAHWPAGASPRREDGA